MNLNLPLLAGRHPFLDPKGQVSSQKVLEEAPNLKHRMIKVSAELETLLQRMLQKDPGLLPPLCVASPHTTRTWSSRMELTMSCEIHTQMQLISEHIMFQESIMERCGVYLDVKEPR